MTDALAPYDRAVPHPGPDAGLAARFADLRAHRPGVDLARVRDVVLLATSSRGGSSMLAELLRGRPEMLSLPAEVNPYVVVAQLSNAGAATVLAELAADVGRPAAAVHPRVLADSVGWRLLAQWPDIDPDPRDVQSWTNAALDGGATDPAAFTRAVLRQARAAHPQIRPTDYDLPAGGDAADADGPSTVRGPGHDPVIEMTPYVNFRPWQLATDDELATLPLVIATPRNSYRLAWWRELFPQARVRVLHLIRNPAAAVNGLVDGWRHDAFYTCRVDRSLSITGYSDAVPWGSSWWKYDVPPDWTAVTDATLAEVSALQWCSAHEQILTFEDSSDVDVFRVRYEDLVGTQSVRDRTAAHLAEWLGIDQLGFRAAVRRGIAPVMATAPPASRRWASTPNDLAPALAEPRVWELTAQLGYEVEERLWI